MACFSYSSWKSHWWACFHKPTTCAPCAKQSLAILFKMEGCVVYCKAPDAKQMSAIMTVYYSLSVPFRKVFICKGQVSNSCNRHCRWQFKMRHFKRQANQSCYYIPFHELLRVSWTFLWQKAPSSHFHNPKWAELTRFLKIYAVSTI